MFGSWVRKYITAREIIQLHGIDNQIKYYRVGVYNLFVTEIITNIMNINISLLI